MTTRTSVTGIAARTARNGDGPGTAGRRGLRSMAWPPAPAISPIEQDDEPAEQQERRRPPPPGVRQRRREAPRPMSDASQPTTKSPGAGAALDRERGGRGGRRRASEASPPGGARSAWSGVGRSTLGRARGRCSAVVERERAPRASSRAARTDRLERRRQRGRRAAAAGDAAGRLDPAGTARSRSARRRDVTALEVLAAPGAQRPVEADQAGAVGADAVEARPARRADDPFVVDPSLAGGAMGIDSTSARSASSARFRS